MFGFQIPVHSKKCIQAPGTRIFSYSSGLVPFNNAFPAAMLPFPDQFLNRRGDSAGDECTAERVRSHPVARLTIGSRPGETP
jgi:hypothetical protein